MKRVTFLILSIIMIVTAIGPASSGFAAESKLVIPTISIVSVVKDKSVTIKTANYPANDTFNVYMGKFGTRAVGGTKVATINTGNGGSFSATFDIPASLKGLYQIAIRLESPTSGYYSYNWFYNNTTNGNGATPPETPYTPLPPGVIPTFSILSVKEDDTVTIQTKNFPANDSFVVRMGAMGTRAVGGVKVDTVDSDDGGKLEFTFDIPSSLKGSYQIAIRLESPTSGYYSYNWFYNNTTTGAGGQPEPGTSYTPLPPGVIPTFSIVGVKKDKTVTIQTKNFPANDSFVVRMGAMGTRAVGGVKVDSVDSEDGGKLKFTFDIPSSLQGSYQIAIRLESTYSGYYSYNWFYNNTYP